MMDQDVDGKNKECTIDHIMEILKAIRKEQINTEQEQITAQLGIKFYPYTGNGKSVLNQGIPLEKDTLILEHTFQDASDR